jgi:Putative rhamnosyl transferase
MPTIQHLLETQFSVRMGRPLTLPWLRERLELLRRYTLPSVAAQTSDNFTWLLLCDETTDPEVLAELREEGRRVPDLQVVLTSDATPPLAAVRKAVDPDADVLITTRLDSDDAIADAYLAAVQDYAERFHRSRHESLLINFPRGYRLDAYRGRLYEAWMPNSSFHSLLERPQNHEPRTIRGEGHANLLSRYARYERLPILGRGHAGAAHIRLHQHYPTHQDDSMHAWLIVVHGGNLINSIGPTARPAPTGSKPVGFTLGEPLTKQLT